MENLGSTKQAFCCVT